MSYIVVAYFTRGTLYEVEVKRLLTSLIRFGIPYYVEPVEDRGSWYLNTQWKPQFVSNMLDKFPDKSIIYVDCDAEFCRPPDLFEILHGRPDVNVGVHLLDHKKRGRDVAFELLSGTIFFKNNKIVRGIVNDWITECSKGDKVWDQNALCKVLQGIPFQVLPEEYCTIFDYMKDIVNPVIKHYQASRKVTSKYGKLPLINGNEQPCQNAIKKSEVVRRPKRVGRGGLVRYHIRNRNSE